MKIDRDFWEELFAVCGAIRDGVDVNSAVTELDIRMHDETVYLPADLVAACNPETFMDTLPAVTEALSKLRGLVRQVYITDEEGEEIDSLCERLIYLIAAMYDTHAVWTH